MSRNTQAKKTIRMKELPDLMGILYSDSDREFAFSEEELDALTKGLNPEVINEMTLSKIRGQTKCIRQSALPISKHRIPKRIALIAAILTLCLAGTVFALSQGYFKEFFTSEVPEEALIRVNQSQVDDGIQMKVSDVMAGSSDAVFFIEFTRTNGKTFPEGSEVSHIHFAVDGQEIGLSVHSKKLLDEGKKLVYCYELLGDQSVFGRTVTVQAEELYTPKSENEQWDVPIGQWYQAYPIHLDETTQPWIKDADTTVLYQEFATQAERADAFPLPLQDKYTQNRLAGLAYIGNSLYIGIYMDNEEEKMTDQTDFYISSLVHTHTGAIYERNGTNLLSSPGNPNMQITHFKGIAETDLPFLEPVISYDTKEIISRGKWDLSYTFQEEGKTLQKELHIQESMLRNGKQETFRLSRLTVSVLGLNLEGVWEHDVNIKGLPTGYSPTIIVVLKDGSGLPVQSKGGHIASSDSVTGEAVDGFQLLYSLKADPDINNRDTVFFTQDLLQQIKAIRIGENTIDFA